MKKLLIGLAALPFLAGVAMAGQPTLLSDAQMDRVTAGDTGLPGTSLIEIQVGAGAGAIELNFFPSPGGVAEVGLDVLAGVSGVSHTDDAPHALGGLVCGISCFWGAS